jgi:hypothetical protein
MTANRALPMPNVIQTVASDENFRKKSGNTQRFGLLHRLVETCARHDASLLVLPAGYLAAEREEEVAGLIAEVQRRAAADPGFERLVASVVHYPSQELGFSMLSACAVMSVAIVIL